MRFGTIFGTTTVSKATEWRTTVGTNTTSGWSSTTETAPMSSATSATTSVPATTETDGTTEAFTTTTTISSSTEPKLMLDNGQQESELGEKGSSSGSFREEIDDELRDSYPAAGNSSISRQKSVQAAQQNATFDSDSRNISGDSHKLRVNMKGTSPGRNQRVKVDVKKLTRSIIPYDS